MWIAKGIPGANAASLLLALARHHRTNGGSSDTEVTEFAVMPTGSPSGPTAVTTVTPVVKRPKMSRSSLKFIVAAGDGESRRG
jgi:hypothetical protein